ncbi:conserved hypothetical protein [uncultured Desulfobacterium sp.]|uniref:Protein kinase domain-containing protein n=1 Tax=uncultured Desulfobacterium sp. TaxID=201089 RepID=A0A445MVE2_9BACT|nr:conserved hypothetical protein [uncultured Desulfobacterium sp.]
MNMLSFFGLLNAIYGSKTPDLEAIQRKGLLAVKIAQHYALRIDFLDEDVCRHLAKLYRSNMSIPSEDIDLLLKGYVSDSWFDELQEFDTVPIASASVGQVHKARLKDNSQVVVKVIKKDFRKSFLDDIRSLRRLIHIAIFFYPRLSRVFDPLGIISHIEDYTLSELNLLNEIHGQETLRKIYHEYRETYDLSRLKFHRLYAALSNENVLVSEYIDGHSFDELLGKDGLPYEKLLDLFSIHGLYLFGRGVFHGDIHPGNVILDKDGYINFIDTSAVSTIGEKIRYGLFRFFEALSFYDYKECANHINQMSEKKLYERNFEKFKDSFYELYDDFADKTVSEVSLTKKMMDTIKLAVTCGMRFEKGMFSIIKSLMYLDGMVLRCRPDAVLIKDMRPFIGDFNKIL